MSAEAKPCTSGDHRADADCEVRPGFRTRSIVCKNQGIAWRYLSFRARHLFPCKIMLNYKLTCALIQTANYYIVCILVVI